MYSFICNIVILFCNDWGLIWCVTLTRLRLWTIGRGVKKVIGYQRFSYHVIRADSLVPWTSSFRPWLGDRTFRVIIYSIRTVLQQHSQCKQDGSMAVLGKPNNIQIMVNDMFVSYLFALMISIYTMHKTWHWKHVEWEDNCRPYFNVQKL